MTTTTTAQLVDMLHADEKARRRDRFERGVSSAQRGSRLDSKKNRPGKGSRSINKRRAIREF